MPYREEFSPTHCDSCQRDDLTKEVLLWLDEAYGVKLDDLPIGKQGYPDSCPIAVALGTYYSNFSVYVSGLYISLLDMGGSVVDMKGLPSTVTEWILRFDKGEYPQYVKEST